MEIFSVPRKRHQIEEMNLYFVHREALHPAFLVRILAQWKKANMPLMQDGNEMAPLLVGNKAECTNSMIQLDNLYEKRCTRVWRRPTGVLWQL